MAISFFSSCTLSTLFQSVKPGVPLVFDRSPGTPRDGYLLSDRWCRSTVQTAEQIVSATISCSVARRRITHATFGSGRLDSATFYRSVYLSSRTRLECQHIFHPFSQRAHSRRSNPCLRHAHSHPATLDSLPCGFLLDFCGILSSYYICVSWPQVFPRQRTIANNGLSISLCQQNFYILAYT